MGNRYNFKFTGRYSDFIADFCRYESFGYECVPVQNSDIGKPLIGLGNMVDFESIVTLESYRFTVGRSLKLLQNPDPVLLVILYDNHAGIDYKILHVSTGKRTDLVVYQSHEFGYGRQFLACVFIDDC